MYGRPRNGIATEPRLHPCDTSNTALAGSKVMQISIRYKKNINNFPTLVSDVLASR